MAVFFRKMVAVPERLHERITILSLDMELDYGKNVTRADAIEEAVTILERVRGLDMKKGKK
jgi:hypothetical protein